LGLWITRHVARLHGGEVLLYSKPGQGCRFVIELPPDPAQGGDDAQQAHASVTIPTFQTPPMWMAMHQAAQK